MYTIVQGVHVYGVIVQQEDDDVETIPNATLPFYRKFNLIVYI